MKTVSSLDKKHFLLLQSPLSIQNCLLKLYGQAHKAIKDATTQEKILSERGTLFHA